MTDDRTDYIQEAVDKTRAGGTLDIPAGRYMIDAVRSINLKSDMTLRLGDNVELVALPNDKDDSAVVRIAGCRNVKIIGNGKIIGGRLNHIGNEGSHGHCIQMIYDVENIEVRNVTCTEGWGDGVCIGTYPGTGRAKNIYFGGVHFEENRRNGLSVSDVDGLIVKGCYFDGNGAPPNETEPRTAIDLETDTPNQSIVNVEIANNTFQNTQGSNISVGSPVGGYGYRNIIIGKNVYDMRRQPIKVTGTAGKLNAPIWAVVLKGLFSKSDSYRYWGYPTEWRSS